MGVRFLHGVENFHQGEVLFVQAAHDFFTCCKNAVYAALADFFLVICTYKNFQKMPIMMIFDQICKLQ